MTTAINSRLYYFDNHEHKIDELRPISQVKCISRIKDGYICIHIRAGIILIVNDTAYLVLQLCDGKHTIKDITEAIAKNYSKVESFVDDVIRFIKEALRFNMVTVA